MLCKRLAASSYRRQAYRRHAYRTLSSSSFSFAGHFQIFTVSHLANCCCKIEQTREPEIKNAAPNILH